MFSLYLAFVIIYMCTANGILKPLDTILLPFILLWGTVFVHIIASYMENYSSHHWHVKLWPFYSFLKLLSPNDPIILQSQKYILLHMHTKWAYPWKSLFHVYLWKIALSSWAWRIKVSKCIKVSTFQKNVEEYFVPKVLLKQLWMTFFNSLLFLCC